MLHRAAAYCSASERCIQDVEKKIKAAGLAGEESDRIVSRLLQERFIDESRFARYFVNDKLRFNKWGRVKINYEMQRKGIPSSIRSEALEGIDEQEYRSILLSLLKSKKKVTRGKDDREVYAKLLRFAAGRGFETRETSRCLKQLFNGNDYEDDLNDLLNLFYPRLCLLCQRSLMEGEEHICLHCSNHLPYTHFTDMETNPVCLLLQGKHLSSPPPLCSTSRKGEAGKS